MFRKWWSGNIGNSDLQLAEEQETILKATLVDIVKSMDGASVRNNQLNVGSLSMRLIQTTKGSKILHMIRENQVDVRSDFQKELPDTTDGQIDVENLHESSRSALDAMGQQYTRATGKRVYKELDLSRRLEEILTFYDNNINAQQTMIHPWHPVFDT